VIEVEGVINSRPLTYVTMNNLEEPLILCMATVQSHLPDAICFQDAEDQDDFEVTTEHLTKRFFYLNRVINNFWRLYDVENTCLNYEILTAIWASDTTLVRSS